MGNINEWTQVYLSGYIPDQNRYGIDNLRDITAQLSNGSRSRGQIYAILRGMGIPEDRAIYAINNFIENLPKPKLGFYDANNKNKLEIMDSNFSIAYLTKQIGSLKEELTVLINQDANRVNYSAQSAKSLVENYQVKLEQLDSTLKRLVEERDPNMIDKLKSGLHPADNCNAPEYYYASKLVSELSQYNSIVPIAEFVGKTMHILETNRYKTMLVNSAYLLESDRRSNFYAPVIEDIRHLVIKEEKDVCESLKTIMQKHEWVPVIKHILNSYAVSEKKLVNTEDGKVSDVYSPVQINEDKSLTFVLGGKYYNLKDEAITEQTDLSKISSVFFNVERALKHFKMIGESFFLYNGKNSLEFNPIDNQVKINDKVVNHTDLNTFRNYLIRTNFFRLDEMYRIDELVFLFEAVDTVKKLDFITSIQSRINESITVNLMKLGTSIYVNRINPMMGVNDLKTCTTAEDAQSLVKEFVNFDISSSVSDLLESEKKVRYEIQQECDSVQEKINYVSKKKEDVVNARSMSRKPEILDEAVKLLDSELKDLEVELQKLYSKMN